MAGQEPTPPPPAPKPLIAAGMRGGRWDRAETPHRPTKTYLKALRTFGYTRVRYLGEQGSHTIEELLR